VHDVERRERGLIGTRILGIDGPRRELVDVPNRDVHDGSRASPKGISQERSDLRPVDGSDQLGVMKVDGLIWLRGGEEAGTVLEDCGLGR
jgi:hypothetical protein